MNRFTASPAAFTAAVLFILVSLSPRPAAALHCPGGQYSCALGEVCLFPIEGDTQDDYYFRFAPISNVSPGKSQLNAVYDLFLIMANAPVDMNKSAAYAYKANDPCFFANGFCMSNEYLGVSGQLRQPSDVAITDFGGGTKLTIGIRVSDRSRYGVVGAAKDTVDIKNLSSTVGAVSYSKIQLEWDQTDDCRMIQRYIGGGLSVTVRHVKDYTWEERKGLSSTLPTGYRQALGSAKKIKAVNKGRYYDLLLVKTGEVNVHRVHEYEIAINEGNYTKQNVDQEHAYFSGTGFTREGISPIPPDRNPEPAAAGVAAWSGTGLCDKAQVAFKTQYAVNSKGTLETVNRVFKRLSDRQERLSAESAQPGASSLVTLDMVPLSDYERSLYRSSPYLVQKFAVQGGNGKYLKYSGATPAGHYLFTEPSRMNASCFLLTFSDGGKTAGLYTTANYTDTCAASMPGPDDLMKVIPMLNFMDACVPGKNPERYVEMQPAGRGKTIDYYQLFQNGKEVCDPRPKEWQPPEDPSPEPAVGGLIPWKGEALPTGTKLALQAKQVKTVGPHVVEGLRADCPRFVKDDGDRMSPVAASAGASSLFEVEGVEPDYGEIREYTKSRLSVSRGFQKFLLKTPRGRYVGRSADTNNIALVPVDDRSKAACFVASWEAPSADLWIASSDGCAARFDYSASGLRKVGASRILGYKPDSDNVYLTTYFSEGDIYEPATKFNAFVQPPADTPAPPVLKPWDGSSLSGKSIMIKTTNILDWVANGILPYSRFVDRSGFIGASFPTTEKNAFQVEALPVSDQERKQYTYDTLALGFEKVLLKGSDGKYLVYYTGNMFQAAATDRSSADVFLISYTGNRPGSAPANAAIYALNQEKYKWAAPTLPLPGYDGLWQVQAQADKTLLPNRVRLTGGYTPTFSEFNFTIYLAP